MDTNRFKTSDDFRNVQKNLNNHHRYSVESYSQQVGDYIHDMKNKNQEAAKQGFMTHAQKSAKEAWGKTQEIVHEAWGKNHSDEKKSILILKFNNLTFFE